MIDLENPRPAAAIGGALAGAATIIGAYELRGGDPFALIPTAGLILLGLWLIHEARPKEDTMSDHYPPGPMDGSGIYDRIVDCDLECAECGEINENVAVVIDRFGSSAMTPPVRCVACGELLDTEVSA